ncbi:hypothetical protein GCM10010168_81880 [Actinoplanes ianthinogenes]|uniref:DUF3455 domain-containing protein n=1 Tax=Actinoplanes ianthinogenes TaxID=122358 RepID=A0ABM7LMH8_9ACTN|nr:DUF3455 domain-containing protein [Actinoplanes ianthinogenes]BCJ40478.1 hypothetical protein Aiant_11350 [Actinoplanes ianthinogenes]GGR50603.1 hypothetical protein GCM10010168_81880 [Actinoplanes ianthinogenes]
MTRTVKIASAVGALALTSVAVPAGVSFAGTDRPVSRSSGSSPASTQEESFLGGEPLVPETLQPPAGNAVHAVLKARGVQIYECRRGMWQPLEPAASLTGVTMSPVKKVTAVHFRGPAWVSDQDGSMVEGTDPVSEPAADGSVPQMLFKAGGNRGGGLFGPVTWIQRLDTQGGAAPKGSCGGDQPVAVPYRAVYRFFTKK